jgi:hypothetical protein
MSRLVLTGLDAQNPLAFLAALGLLRVLDEHAVRDGLPRPRLGFAEDGRQTPFVDDAHDSDDGIAILLADAVRRGDDPVLQLCYDDTGRAVAPNTGGTRDLKPAPASARELLDRVASGPRTTADLAAALFSELVQDNNGNTKPTAFHFTAGQQQFLEMVEALRTGITEADLREALFGPWIGASTLPSLTWDATVARLYALRAGNPSKEKRGSVPAANWLGVLGLAYFPVTVERNRLVTTCVTGGWKDSSFTWPVWTPPSTSPTIAALLRTNVAASTSDARKAIGIAQVLSARILRSDQGGYGSFTPAEVVLPPRAR